MKFKYLPEMNPVWVLYWYNNDDQPREPVYSFGPVVLRGENLPTGNNHANDIDKNGSYDIVKFLKDHASMFPIINRVATGQLCPHITAGVDCESLFSQSCYVSNPCRANTTICYYKIHVELMYRLGRIYCHIPTVVKTFMKRFKANDWNENLDVDEFLELEKQIYLDMFPHNNTIFDDDEKEDTQEDSTLKPNENKNAVKKGDGKRKEDCRRLRFRIAVKTTTDMVMNTVIS
jgi:hypothetical protein